MKFFPAALFGWAKILGGSIKTSSVTVTGATASLPVFTDANKQLVTKSVADTLIALGIVDPLLYKGVIDCSGSPNYPAADAGHCYVVSVAGKLGGASGVVVAVGDMAICKTDSSASGDQATVGANWNVVEKNLDLTNVTITGGSISGTAIRAQTKTISSSPVTLTEAECKNSTIYLTTGASVVNLPAGSATLDGAAFVAEAIAAVAPSIDPNGVEVLVVDGQVQAGGNKITFDGVAGTAVLFKYDATASRWRVSTLSGLVIDGGA